MLVAYSIIAVIAMAAEFLWPARQQRFFRRGLFTDGIYVVVNIGLRILITNTIAVAFTRFGQESLPTWVPVGVLSKAPIVVQALGVILVLDFFFYWMHRGKHHFEWWWRLHETHHSSQDLHWFSSVRFHPLEKITDRLIYLFPLMFLGVGEEALLILSIVDATIASFSHANIRLRLGPLNYLIVGPEMHRWHHAVDASNQGRNFGNNLSIFDWIFRTAILPKERPEVFGIEEDGFPEGNILKQFAFAFRPLETQPRDRKSETTSGS